MEVVNKANNCVILSSFMTSYVAFQWLLGGGGGGYFGGGGDLGGRRQRINP